jgi:hypothetical protein
LAFDEFLSRVDWPRMAGGATLCLFGWMLYWIGVRAVGLVLGGAAGAAVCIGIAYAGGWDAHEAAAATGGLIGAAFGWFAIRRVHAFAFFMIGSAAGGGLGWLLAPSIGEIDWVQQYPGIARIVFVSLTSLICGVALATLSRYVITIVTAAGGAALIVRSGQPEDAGVVFASLFLISLSYQLGMVQKFVSTGEKLIDGEPEDEFQRVREDDAR